MIMSPEMLKKFREQLFGVPGFDQFRDRDDIKLIPVNSKTDKYYIRVSLKTFYGINIKEINRFCFGPYEFADFSNVEGHTTYGDSDGINIQFTCGAKEMRYV